MITMTQIAKLTNVSQPTVSRVLNGHPNVAPEIRARVLACAKEHDYQFNILARSLQGGRTGLVALLVPESGLAGLLEQALRGHGCGALLLGGGMETALDTARRYRVDGLLVVPRKDSVECWSSCAKKLDAPAVAVSAQVEGLDSVYADHRQAGALAARHLMDKGYSRFIFIGPEASDKCAGFRDALADLGLGSRTEVLPDDQKLNAALDTRFRRPSRTGIFVHSDQCALRVLNILRELGVQVPWRAGVMGFGDTDVCPYLIPRLSSVREPLEAMASQAVDRLLHRIEQPDDMEVLDVPLPVELVPRETT